MRYFTIFSIIIFISCSRPNSPDLNNNGQASDVIVEAERQFANLGDFLIESGSVLARGDGWLEFHIEVPQAGRYRVEVVAANGSPEERTTWIEDYIDNKDDRRYNITGNIDVPGNNITFRSYVRDGSPMNKGQHKIRLHVEKDLRIDKIGFKLLKPHVKTSIVKTQDMTGEEWIIAWSDEFNDSELDTSKWLYDIGDWGWGNGEHQYYTENRYENVRLEDGNLIIEAHKNDQGHRWTSGRLTTRGKVSFVHGKIEFRAKVPKRKGNWAAGWTLGDSYVDEISWPYCGEIDILESVGFEMDDETGTGIAHASAHCGAYYFKIGNQPTGILQVDKMDTEFHDYAVEWTSDYIKAYVDDQHYFTYDDNSTDLSWPFDDPQNLILNLAMGGGWGGAQGMDTTVTSQKMFIDYVRVYERR